MCGAEGRDQGMSSTRPAPIRAVLFDLDGTLVATRRLYLEAFADALEPVMGRRPGHDEMMALRPRAEIRFLREVGGEDAHPVVMERFYRAYQRRHDGDFQGIYPGVPEMLVSLRSLDLPLGLVTGKSRRAWRVTGPRVRLGPFPVTVFDDDVPRSKPDPSGLQAAVLSLSEMGMVDPEVPGEVLYVGDASTDLEAAAAAGVRPGAVLWSKRAHEREKFRAQSEALGGLVFSTPEQLVEVVHSSGVYPLSDLVSDG